jgi:DNA-binding transcriptional ArsR family regulator
MRSQCIFSQDFIVGASNRFQLLATPMRLRILRSLEGGEKTVGQLAEALNGKQPNVSKQLKILADAAVLGRRFEGTSVHYFLLDPGILILIDAFFDSSLRNLKAKAESMGFRVAASSTSSRKQYLGT